MLARGASRCRQTLRTAIRSPTYSYGMPKTRPYTASAGAVPASASHSPAHTGLLAPFTSELDKIAPSFKIRGSQIHVIQTPADFYDTLKAKIRNAKRRIFLSTLYIGKSEEDLISTLQEALRSNPELKLSILTDYLRGVREAPHPSSASLLAPLVKEFGPDRVELRMYHTPNLTGLRKKYIPKRINEGWGLQHMKLYGIDDEIILSGANLSSDYFTNRQDRYHLFKSMEITEHFSRIHHGASSLSFRLRPSDQPAGFDLVWPKENAAPSPLEEPSRFVSEASTVINRLISPGKVLPSVTSDSVSNGSGREPELDTTVYMLAQMSQLLRPDTSTELPAVTHVLKTLAQPTFAGSSWTFTAGYFNPAPSLTKLLMQTASSNSVVITAAPEANGFYGSKGVSGMLPAAYTYLAHRFLRDVHRHKKDAAVTLKEWRKGTVGEPEGWTYHAKGLWITLPSEENPSMSVVGSSNFTKRSYSLDLEAGAMIVTENEDLKKQLGQEQRHLQEHTKAVTLDDFARNDRRVSLKVRISMWIVSALGGAL